MNIVYNSKSIPSDLSQLNLNSFTSLVIQQVVTPNPKDSLLRVNFHNSSSDIKRIETKDFTNKIGMNYIYNSGVPIDISTKKPVLLEIVPPDPTLTVYIDFV